MIDNLPNADYYTLVVTVPATDADTIRNAMAKAGAGKFGDYSHCTFSVKGTDRFMPLENAHPTLGTKQRVQIVREERIETVCAKEYLEQVVTAIKEVHPYECTIIDIYPVYKIGIKMNRHD